MDHGTQPSVSGHSSSLDRACDIMVLCSVVVVVTAVRIMQQIHTVAETSKSVLVLKHHAV